MLIPSISLEENDMKRVYDTLLAEHFSKYRQMAFLSGPRQVGKTTTARSVAKIHRYLNWDDQTQKRLITAGPAAVAKETGLDQLVENAPLVVFDEIHKYGKWKKFLKGFFDQYGERCRTVVTGSARLNVYKKGGDSLMGRYFPYRMHPLSVRELATAERSDATVQPPVRITKNDMAQLLEFGGFPEPFLAADRRFFNRWKKLRFEQLLREDVRDLTRITELGQMEQLARILETRAGGIVNYSNLAADINTSVDTVTRWMRTLESLYYCFRIYPYSTSIPKSLRKQPKVYLHDWSGITDTGALHENFVAVHLQKTVDLWTDAGYGEFGLFYLRDKAKREVDFLVTKERKPYFLVEVKSSAGDGLSPALHYFQEVTGAPHAFQAAFDIPYAERDCFTERGPIIVPAQTLLSQLG